MVDGADCRNSGAKRWRLLKWESGRFYSAKDPMEKALVLTHFATVQLAPGVEVFTFAGEVGRSRPGCYRLIAQYIATTRTLLLLTFIASRKLAI